MQRLIMIGVLVLVCAPAWAQDSVRGWYVGGGLGATHTSADVDKDLVSGVSNCVADLGLTSCSSDKADSGYQLVFGYRFSPLFAIEGGYVDLGNTLNFTTYDGAGVYTYQKQTTTGFKAVAVGYLPLPSRFAVGGKFGVFLWNSEASQRRDPTGTFAPNSVSDNGLGLTLGLRATYALTPRLALSLDWDQYANLGKQSAILDNNAVFSSSSNSLAQTVKVNASLFSLNLFYRFR